MAQTFELIEERRPNAAALEVINLGDGFDHYPVADKLDVLGVPYLFATGDVKLADASVYRHRPWLEKPFREALYFGPHRMPASPGPGRSPNEPYPTPAS